VEWIHLVLDMDCCEHSNKPSSSTNGENFQLVRDYPLLKKYYAPQT
jgi:hypothetical protein